MRPRWLIALVAFATASCGRGRGCVDGQTRYETLDGKVKVSLVRNVHWAGGKIPGPLTEFVLHVETTPPFSESVRCAHVDLAEDDAGKNIGYRCKGEQAWTILRLRGGARRIRECNAPVGTGMQPAFEKLQPVSAIVDRVLDCGKDAAESALREQTNELVRAVREDDGSEAAIKLTLALSAREEWYGSFGAWHGALDALDDGDRRKTLEKLCATLTLKDPAPPAQYVRAALRCPLDTPAVTAGALAVLGARLGRPYPPNRDMKNASAWERSLRWAAIVASEKSPAEAGALACAAAKAVKTGDEIAGSILGRTGTPCEAVKAWQLPCGSQLDCNDHLCTHEELLADTKVWHDLVTTTKDDERIEPEFLSGARVILFATYANGPLPVAIALPNARRFYAFAEVPEGSPWCHHPIDAGTVCRCNDVGPNARCDLSPNETHLRYAGCAVHFDDAKQQIDEVRSTCESEGSKCNFSSIICCAGLRCLPGKEVCAKTPP